MPRLIPADIVLPQRLFERTRYRLQRPLTLCGITVPAGFVSDGASVPRMFWWLFPPVGRYMAAAILHDWLLETGTPWPVANGYFLRALREQGVERWAAYVMYAAVSVYGAAKRLLAA